MPKTNLRQQIFIDALPDKIWEVLTSCDYINQYFPHANIHSQWTEGSAIVLKGERGEVETIPKGKVLQVIPGVRLKYQLVEELSTKPTVITYEVIPSGVGNELKYHSEGFADGEEAYLLRMKEARLILQKIKWLAEYA